MNAVAPILKSVLGGERIGKTLARTGFCLKGRCEMDFPYEDCYEITHSCQVELGLNSCAGCEVFDRILAKADAEHDRQKEEG